MAKSYKREANGRRFMMTGGLNTYATKDLIPPTEYAFLQNVRKLLDGRITDRPTQSAALYTLAAPPHSGRRLNDTTPAGPVAGYVRIIGAAGVMYVNATSVATGLSGNPVSIELFRPNTSVQPWAYIGDSAPSPNVTVTSAFNCSGMIKIRSDGLSRKTGIKEPQAAPTVSFTGGGSGPVLISYKYVYVSNETGAQSNPSPVSIPGTNSQSNPSESVPATAFATNYSFNAAQWEYAAPQLRTKSPTPLGTLDFVTVRGMGFTIPTGVTINGIQVDLNWIGQNSGTGTLSSAALFYLGNQIGNAKFPGVQNQSFSADTFVGGSGDAWGAILTPEIINDPSFGFGVQITKQSVGGSDRSFINFMAVTVYYSTQNADITPVPSVDPQVGRIDIYRQGGGLANFTYIGTNPNAETPFTDTLSDLAAAANRQLETDNFEPFPGIDLPRSGVLNASGNVLTRVSGDLFNIRWLPGTIILIGSPTQQAYVAVQRPTSTSLWDFQQNDPLVPAIPDGTNLKWNIAEPGLAQVPLASIWGPTDNTAYMFGVGDALRPNTLYFTKGNNPDSAPDTNQIEVGDAGIPLMNGVIIGGIGMVFSTEKAWLIFPTFTTALATVSGVQGQPFNLQESIADRGLYIRNCICTEGGVNVFFRAKDGIYVSPGGTGSQSITDTTIYNLFPHSGENPVPITIAGNTVYPPDDTQSEKQKLHFATGYLYYDYVDTTNVPRTLVFDVAAKGWSVDIGNPTFTLHVLEEGPNVNDTIVGCSDNTVRLLNGTGTETISAIVATGVVNFGDARAPQRIGDVFIRAFINSVAPISLAMYSNLYLTPVTGFSPTSLTGAGALVSPVIDFTNARPRDVQDLASVYTWNIGSNNYLDLWQTSWMDLPEITQNRSTDWNDSGTNANKFYQGLTLEANTFGVAKTFSVEDDQGVLHTPVECPITFNGQTVKTFTFNPPFTSHQVRIVTSDGVQWQPFATAGGDAEWAVQPYPESSTLWQAEPTTFGGLGYQHAFLVNLAYICASPVTVTLLTDNGTYTVTLPASTSQAQPSKNVGFFLANKWKVCTFSASSVSKITLFKDLTELWTKSWGFSTEYQKQNPYGGNSSPSVQL